MSDTVVAPRVLIAEDEPLIRMDLVELLESEGYQVVGQAADGEQAVQLAEELHPDICVLDVKMPILDGISAAEIITAKGVAPVVMLTAFSQRDLVDRAARAGAMAYVVKPFQASDVVPAMALAIARFQQLQEIKEEISDLSEQLEVRKLIDQAKGMLQERLGLSEAESFRWIQKTAMDLRKSKREVAEGVLAHGKSK